ncbi:hypothetical protein EJ02DRAFT_437783 [Clathrospora elynae]|uniref:F-box domain-containing protein n=1 Tax=Clathrospora elynae TaxID=706981 RepID=A0A6A5SJK6_9PLEO|nr:hypothetical protein EJ02DRAFT_437783 [Clathrospora elynae]
MAHPHATILLNRRQMNITPFDQLADEIWLQIIAYITNSDNERLLSSKKHPEDQRDLRNVALVCKRLQPIAQEILFHTPLLRDDPQNGRAFNYANILKFTQIMIASPELRKHVKQLRIQLPKDDYVNTSTWSAAASAAKKFRHAATAHIDQGSLPTDFKQVLKDGLLSRSRWPAIGVLLTLTPSLQRLSLLPNELGCHYPNLPHEANILQGMFLACFPGRKSIIHTSVQHLPALQNLSYLKINLDRLWRVQDLNYLPQLTTLDIEPIQGENYEPQMQEFRIRNNIEEERRKLDQVSHLRWDCRSYPSSRSGETLLKNFSAVFLFNNLQVVDIYGNSTHDPQRHHGFSGNCNMRMVLALGHLKDTLRTLRLPSMFARRQQQFGNFPADLRDFPKLTKLLVPQSYLNTRHLHDFSMDPPVDHLPPALEYLTIYGADSNFFDWIVNFIMVETQYSALKNVRVLFAPDPIYTNEDYKNLTMRVIRKSFWRAISKSHVQWTIGRDRLDYAFDILE